DRVAHLAEAVRALRAAKGIIVRRVSPVWTSAPAGYRRQPWFHNAAARLSTALPPSRLLGRLKTIERTLGRRPGRRWGPRVIDLDLLLYGERVIGTGRLVVPHPGLVRRAFVLAPVTALAPRLRHPVSGIPLVRLLRRSPGRVRRLPPAEQRRFIRLALRSRPGRTERAKRLG